MAHLFKPQPLKQIKDYYGGRIAIYFAFYGYYNYMLMYLSLVGLLVYAFGMVTVQKHPPIRELCSGSYNNFLHCPMSRDGQFSNFTTDDCDNRQVAYRSVNLFTIVFGVFVSLWSGFVYQDWKKYISEITATWDAPEAKLKNEPARKQFIVSEHVLTQCIIIF